MSVRSVDEVVIRTADGEDVDAIVALWQVAAAASSTVSDNPAGVRLLLARDPESMDGRVVRFVRELDGREPRPVGTP